jgi:hypothetical protein
MRIVKVTIDLNNSGRIRLEKNVYLRCEVGLQERCAEPLSSQTPVQVES